MNPQRQFPAIRLCSACIFIISLMAVVGHLEHNPSLYNWHGQGTMSIPTAVCFMVSSWALFILGLERAKENNANH